MLSVVSVLLFLIFEEMTEIQTVIEREIEERAAAKAAEMFAEMQAKSGVQVPQLPSDIAPNGQVVTPFLVGGVKYLTRKDAAALLGIDLPALWIWTEKRNVLKKHKVGSHVYYEYDEVASIIHGNGRKEVSYEGE